MHHSVRPALFRLLSRSPEGEGNLEMMYRDRLGFVTAGVGFKIDPRNLAHDMTWLRNTDHLPAGPQEIDTEWNSVKSRQVQYGRNLHLSPAEINRVFDERMYGFACELVRIFPQFERYPPDAQCGMLVHAWGVGTGRLRSTWHNYTRACLAGDWARASRECHWNGIRPCRRHDMEVLFNNAHVVESTTTYSREMVIWPMEAGMMARR